MVDMNDSMSWVKGSWFYEQFRDMDDMNDSVWWAQGSRCYEQFRVVDDMNYLGYRELKPLDAMNSLGLHVIWMILGPEEKTPNVMNNSSLWMTGMTPGYELRALDAMNNSRLWLIYTPWAHGFRCYELLGVVDDMNDLRSCKLKPLGTKNAHGYGWYERFLVMSLRL